MPIEALKWMKCTIAAMTVVMIMLALTVLVNFWFIILWAIGASIWIFCLLKWRYYLTK